MRPPAGSDDPYQTDARYCVYDEPFRTYLYTSAWAKRILNEIGTVERYRAFFGREHRMKVGTLFDRSEEVEELTPVPADQSA